MTVAQIVNDLLKYKMITEEAALVLLTAEADAIKYRNIEQSKGYFDWTLSYNEKTKYIYTGNTSDFNDDENDKIFKLFKRLMYSSRYSIETSIDEDDKKTSKFINDFWKEWPALKKELAEIMSKLKQSWLKEIKVKTDVGYLG